MALEPDDVEFADDEEDWGPEPELPAGRVDIVVQSRTADPAMLRSMVRLMVGGAAEGGELFFERLRAWNAKTESLGSQVYHEAPDESRGERLRYVVLGLAWMGTKMAQATMAGTAAASESAYGFFSGLLSPVTGSSLMRPVTRRYNLLAARGQADLERLIDAGRAAEQLSRAVAREAYDEGSTEVIQVAVGKLAEEPAVRDLVTQQGTGMASEMIEVLREGTSKADARWARRVRALFGQPHAVTTFATPTVAPAEGKAAVAGKWLATPAGHLQPAGFVSRLMAFVLDVIIVTISSIILGALIALVLNFFGLGAEQLKAGSPNQILQLIRALTVGLSALAVVLFVPLYFIVFWSLAGVTPGKRLLGLRIVHDGQPTIAWPRGLLRYIGYFLSALPLFLGYFWVLADSKRQGWHDKLAQTHVVYAREAPSSE